MSGGDVNIKQKTKWVLGKSRMSLRRASLDSLKLTLNLFMHTLEFMESGEIDQIIKEEVDRLIMDSKNTKTDLLNAEHADRRLISAHQADNNTKMTEGIRIESSESPSQNAINILTTRAFGSLDIDSSKSKKKETDADADMQLQLYDAQANFSLMQSISDDDFILIAQHIRAGNYVVSFALVVMDPSRDFLEKIAVRSVKSMGHSKAKTDPNSRQLIRFRFNIPAENIWYPTDLCRDMKVSRSPNIHYLRVFELTSFLKEMHGKILDIVHSSGIHADDREMIRDGEYTLLDSKQQVILARFWKDTVKAGTEIILRTNPSSYALKSPVYNPRGSRVKQMGATSLWH
ncbi:MAG: hypothetical protein Q9160_009363 [Pyrenula sp. 1 TL-2023]